MSLIVGLSLIKSQQDISANQQREIANRFFKKIVIPHIKGTLDRSNSALNIEHPRNYKAYFDNSRINNLFDVIDKYYYQIVDFDDHFPSNHLSKLLIKFYAFTNKAYRVAEEMDSLLIKMAASSKLDTRKIGDGYLVIFTKGLRYAKFDQEELTIWLYNTERERFYDLVDHFFSNPENNIKKKYKDKFELLNPEVLNQTKKLKGLINEIESLVKNYK